MKDKLIAATVFAQLITRTELGHRGLRARKPTEYSYLFIQCSW